MVDFTYALEEAWPALMRWILQGNVNAVLFELNKPGRPVGWTYRIRDWSYCFKLTTPEVLVALRTGIRKPERFHWDPAAPESDPHEFNHYLNTCCNWPPQLFDQNGDEFYELGENMLADLHRNHQRIPMPTRQKILENLNMFRGARQEYQIKQKHRLLIEANAGQIQRRTAEPVRAAPTKDPDAVNRWVMARTRRSKAAGEDLLAAAYDNLVPAGPQETPFDLYKSYRRRALEHHPDRGGDSEKMKRVNASKQMWQKAGSYQKKRVLQDAQQDRR
jgi:hypothetical protein